MPVVNRDTVRQAADSSDVTDDLWHSPDWRRVLQLALAAIWMLDGLLQLQPFFFTRGSSGFSGMLAATAPGNPAWVAHSITWDASLIGHHTELTNALFAAIQVLIALGIAWRPTIKAALSASIVWSLGVWWFGEGLGGILAGSGSPIAGGPGAVLIYALLAVLLWPSDSSDPTMAPFAAAQAIGSKAARVIWMVVWLGLAGLMIGEGRTSQGVHDVIATDDVGQPAWLATIDRHTMSLVTHRGLGIAIVFTLLFLAIGASVLLPRPWARAGVVVAVVVAAAIWVFGENFGMILPGSATDPNSGPLLILFALAYWPLSGRPADQPAQPAVPAERVLTLEAG
jgi:hypothetical protein